MRQLFRDDRGVAAIVVTVIVMLILVVTTLGIASLAWREQRQSLDRQLSAEAYYAAEAGVNDVIQTLKTTPSASSKDCTTNPSDYWNSVSGAQDILKLPTFIGNGYLGGATAQSQYTCVLTDGSPSSLEYSQVAPDNGAVSYFTTTTGVDRLIVGWENYLGSYSGLPACGSVSNMKFYNAKLWTSTIPVLKLDVTDLSAGFGRRTMILNTNSFYLYPCNGGGVATVNFVPTTASDLDNNSIVGGMCANISPNPPTKPRQCNVGIKFGGSGPTKVLIRISPIYGTAKVSVIALDNNGKPIGLQGGQKIIDVTAKSNDVVQRIQVRYSDSSQYIFAVDSANSICKRLKVTPSSGDYANQFIPAADVPICSPGVR